MVDLLVGSSNDRFVVFIIALSAYSLRYEDHHYILISLDHALGYDVTLVVYVPYCFKHDEIPSTLDILIISNIIRVCLVVVMVATFAAIISGSRTSYVATKGS